MPRGIPNKRVLRAPEKTGGELHPEVRHAVLKGAPMEALLDALKDRGGTWAQLAEAGLLVLRKSADYNREALDGGDSSVRDVYFPFGQASYAQMIHVKSQRLNSLVDAGLKGRAVNFEGVRDTCLDLINYASFLAERVRREEGK